MGGRRDHFPFSLHQHNLWTSQVKGMEQCVCSFQSFISIVPPNPRSELYKPLPPTPDLTPLSPCFSPASSHSLSTAGPWTAWEEREWSHVKHTLGPHSKSLPLLSTRKYSSPLPDQIPGGVHLSDADAHARPHKSSTARPSRRKLNQGKLYIKLDLSSRDPAKHSRSQTICTCGGERGPGVASTTTGWKRPSTSSGQLEPTIFSNPYPVQPPWTAVAPCADWEDSASDASAEVKCLEWSSIASPRPDAMDWDEFPGAAEAADKTQDAQEAACLSNLHGPVPGGLQEGELARKLEQLSVAESGRDSCSDKSDSRCRQGYTFPAPSKDVVKPARSFASPTRCREARLLVPDRRRSGRKKSGDSFACSVSSRPESDVHSSFETMRARKVSIVKMKASEVDTDTTQKREIRLPSLLTQTRNSRSFQRRAKWEKSRYQRRSLSTPSLSSPPAFHLADLPRSSASSPTMRRSALDLSQLPDRLARPRMQQQQQQQQQQQELSPMSASGEYLGARSGTARTRHPLSQRSRAHPMIAVQREVPSPSTLPPSPRHQLYSPLSPCSPSACGSPVGHRRVVTAPVSPATPDSPCHNSTSSRSFRCGNLLFGSSSSSRVSESGEEHENQIPKLLGKAKSARDIWKRHQQEAKRQKLKQSIRVLGPTDLATALGQVHQG